MRTQDASGTVLRASSAQSGKECKTQCCLRSLQASWSDWSKSMSRASMVSESIVG